MPHATSTAYDHGAIRCERARLFKRDRPREIDRYIDYFGGPASADARVDDPCGEAWLERRARQHRDRR
ncbi:MAG: hypothetical protein ACREJG_13715 [Candidatus Rokuibacteriota bacterium]